MTTVSYTEKTHFKISPNLLDAARQAAAQEDMTLSEFVRDSIRRRIRTMRDDDFGGNGPAPLAACLRRC